MSHSMMSVLPARDTWKTYIYSTKPLEDDDMEIFIDFVSEALENLDTIEVNLIDLEQDPSNTDIIKEKARNSPSVCLLPWPLLTACWWGWMMKNM